MAARVRLGVWLRRLWIVVSVPLIVVLLPSRAWADSPGLDVGTSSPSSFSASARSIPVLSAGSWSWSPSSPTPSGPSGSGSGDADAATTSGPAPTQTATETETMTATETVTETAVQTETVVVGPTDGAEVSLSEEQWRSVESFGWATAIGLALLVLVGSAGVVASFGRGNHVS